MLVLLVLLSITAVMVVGRAHMEWLKQQEPEIVFDAAKLKTESDWIRAGELVFNAPIAYQDASSSPFLDPRFYEQAAIPVANDGTVPFRRYVIRKKGAVEVRLLLASHFKRN